MPSSSGTLSRWRHGFEPRWDCSTSPLVRVDSASQPAGRAATAMTLSITAPWVAPGPGRNSKRSMARGRRFRTVPVVPGADPVSDRYVTAPDLVVRLPRGPGAVLVQQRPAAVDGHPLGQGRRLRGAQESGSPQVNLRLGTSSTVLPGDRPT